MYPIEEKILSRVASDSYIGDCEAELYALPIGQLSVEFYTDVDLKTYCRQENARTLWLSLRIALEEYIASDRSQQYLDNIAAVIQKLPSPIISVFPTKGLQNKAAGTYLLPVSSGLICQVYQLNDEPLSDLFQTYFPIPSSQLFQGQTIPNRIKKREAAILATMKKVDIESLTPFIIKIQRRIRMKRRYREEVNRIAQRDEFYLRSHRLSVDSLLKQANKPYQPQCNPELAKRIMVAAKKVVAFSTVKHITSATAIQSIFDDALYGRRTLMDFYLRFEPAALGSSDILNGDANVVCLGPHNIDPSAKGAIVIEFSLPKLIKNKPSAFFKQRDLEYQVDTMRSVRLGKKTISFNHTGTVRGDGSVMTYLQIDNSSRTDIYNLAEFPKSLFISYNFRQMHEILTLNFFRFMDRMTDYRGKIDRDYINGFYAKLAALTDDELVSFLTDLEKKMTDTAEFNFYGAHQIDFSTILKITERYKEYTLHMAEFIHELQQGHLDVLRQARINIPELFTSYRFIDYLLGKVQQLDVRYYLDFLRKRCDSPSWVQYTPLSTPEGFEPCWQMSAEFAPHEQVVLCPIMNP